MSLRYSLVLVVATAALGACARVESTPEPMIAQQGEVHSVPKFLPTRGRITDHVVVVSIDGLRPDAIAKYKATTLQRLMRDGRYSLNAHTITNSNTLPSHSSMLTGVGAETHGINWNSDKVTISGYIPVPTIFNLAHKAGFTTAAFFSKEKFHALEQPGTLDFSLRQEGEMGMPWGSDRAAGYVAQYLSDREPNLLFVHLAEADFVGHNFGWMTKMYGMAVLSTDRALEQVLIMANKRFGEGKYTVIVTADHGGHGKRHGTMDKLDITIPWIVWGQGVHQMGDTLTGIRTMDTAATALWMLGVDVPATFEGRPVSSAFESSVTASHSPSR